MACKVIAYTRIRKGDLLFMKEDLKVRLLSSLAKVFADEELVESPWNKGSMLCNEVYSFQVAYYWPCVLKRNVQILIKSELSSFVTVREVGLIPSEMPCYGDHDDNVLRTTPGLYPEILLPISNEGIRLLPEQWRTLWDYSEFLKRAT